MVKENRLNQVELYVDTRVKVFRNYRTTVSNAIAGTRQLSLLIETDTWFFEISTNYPVPTWLIGWDRRSFNMSQCFNSESAKRYLLMKIGASPIFLSMLGTRLSSSSRADTKFRSLHASHVFWQNDAGTYFDSKQKNNMHLNKVNME